MYKVIIESVGTYKDRVLEGIALTPTFSKNGNAYTPDVIDNAQNVGVQLKADWEHTAENVGNVVYSVDKENHILFYKATITDPKRALEIKEGVHKVSIEARVDEISKTCTKQRCYNTPLNLAMEGIGITTSPGVLTTTLSITESIPKIEGKCPECLKEDAMGDCMSELKDKHPEMAHDQMVAVCMNKTGQSNEAAYPWDQCIQDQLDKGYDEDSAKKICGTIKAQNESVEELKAEIEQLKKALTCPTCGGIKKK